MTCFRIGRLGAALSLAVLSSSCVTLFGQGPGPERFSASTRQFEALLPALDLFRETYLRDYASCGRDAECVPGSKPNFADPGTGTSLELAFAYSYQMCLKVNGCLALQGEAFAQCAKKCQ